MAERTKLAIGAAAGTLIAAWYRRHRRRDPWEAMLDKALPAIVVIRVNYVKPFDGEQAGSGSATGFVVDFERGLILTNRHVIGTGPIRAEATFVNKEEVSKRRPFVVLLHYYESSPSDEVVARVFFDFEVFRAGAPDTGLQRSRA